MGNILNYLHNNANISFKQLPFNVVDSLIIYIFSYLLQNIRVLKILLEK